MRSLTKRLTVVQRNNHEENQIAIEKVRSRYISKMEKKGWVVDQIFEGNDFLLFESVVEMHKPTPEPTPAFKKGGQLRIQE
mgnify:CR=1 FL=1